MKLVPETPEPKEPSLEDETARVLDQAMQVKTALADPKIEGEMLYRMFSTFLNISTQTESKTILRPPTRDLAKRYAVMSEKIQEVTFDIIEKANEQERTKGFLNRYNKERLARRSQS